MSTGDLCGAKIRISLSHWSEAREQMMCTLWAGHKDKHGANVYRVKRTKAGDQIYISSRVIGRIDWTDAIASNEDEP